MPDNRREDSDRAAIERILAGSQQRLITIAAAILKDRHEAEDVVQETSVAVWQRLRHIAPAKLDAYMARAVWRNARKRATRRRTTGASTAALDHDVPASHRNWPVDPMDLEEAIENLPIAQQTAIKLRFYAGMTFREIGITLSIPAYTAASRCRYALAKLKQRLDG